MGAQYKESMLRRVPRGVSRGVLGAMAMTGVRQLFVGFGLIERPPPEAVLAEGVPEILRGVPEHRRTAVIELAHWGYGAAAGAAYSLLPVRARRHRITGPVYGVAVWAAFEVGVAPALGLAHAHRSRPAERVALLFDHLLYGLVLGVPPKRPAPLREEAGSEDDQDGSRNGPAENRA